MRWSFVFKTVSIAILSTAMANADDSAEGRANVLFSQGNAYFKEANYATALDAYKNAYLLLPNVKILLNIGTTQAKLGLDADAANSYAIYIASQAADPVKISRVEEQLRQLDKRLAKLRVELSDSNTRVLIDGMAVIGKGGYLVHRVKPGTHTIRGERDGSSATEETITVIAGEERVISLHPTMTPPDTSVTAATPQEASRIPNVAARPPQSVPPAMPAAQQVSVSEPRAPDSPVRSSPHQEEKSTAQVLERPLSHLNQLGGLARVDVEGQGRGAVGAIGISYGVGNHCDLGLSALLGHDKGIEPEARVLFFTGAVKPVLSIGSPIFFVEGVRPGLRASVGIQLDPSRQIGIFLQAGAAFFPNAPDNYERVVFIPSIGVQPRIF